MTMGIRGFTGVAVTVGINSIAEIEDAKPDGVDTPIVFAPAAPALK